jgi:hypothetical protein
MINLINSGMTRCQSDCHKVDSSPPSQILGYHEALAGIIHCAELREYFLPAEPRFRHQWFYNSQ